MITGYTEIEWNYQRNGEEPDEAMLNWSPHRRDWVNDAEFAVPIANLRKSEGSMTFIGRLLSTLLKFSDVRKTAYVEKYMAFYNLDTRNPDITLTTINMLKNCVGAAGLHGIDKLMAHRITKELGLVHK